MVRLEGTLALVLGGILASNLLTGMFIAMASLAAITVLGLVYPFMHKRTHQPSFSSDQTTSFISFGSDEMNRRLEGFKTNGEFDEGIIFVYKSLRDLIPSINETGSKDWTEFELLRTVLESSPELRNVSALIKEAYLHYEATRFGNKGDASSFESIAGLVNEISRRKGGIRAKAKRP